MIAQAAIDPELRLPSGKWGRAIAPIQGPLEDLLGRSLPCGSGVIIDPIQPLDAHHLCVCVAREFQRLSPSSPELERSR